MQQAAVRRIVASFPKVYAPLLESKSRYLCYWGSRGGAKSWAIARALLLRGMQQPLRILCTREVQSSIKDSVHKLLKDQIALLGIGPVAEGGTGHYRVLDDVIRGPHGTEFIFKGLRDPASLQSTESVSVCWVEEARNVSKASWERLIPTIRKPGSQIIISFNPILKTDDTYKRFVLKPPPGAIVQHTTWRHNPWFSDELRAEKDHLKATDYDAYLNVWEGQCVVALEGAVYVKELRAATAEGRICKVPLERTKPVHTFWDLGRSDSTAIWFVQLVGFEHRILHSYSANGYALDHYLGMLEQLRQERGWFYGTHWLPHDADHKLLASRRTIKQQMLDANHRVKIVPNIKVGEGINAARTIFPTCWFDEEHCSDGLDALRQYHFEVDDDGTRSKNPEHDWSSHYSDAWRYLGVALREEPSKTKPMAKVRAKVPTGRTAWMAR